MRYSRDRDHRAEWEWQAPREHLEILPPLLLDQAATENAGPAVEVVDRRRQVRFDQGIIIAVIDAKMRLGLVKRDGQKGRGGDANGGEHRPALLFFGAAFSVLLA